MELVNKSLHIPGLRPWALFLSIILHFLLFPPFFSSIKNPQLISRVVEVDLVNTEPVIVSESEAPEKKVATNRLSSKDTATDKEQIKRGLPQPKNIKSAPTQSQAQKQIPTSESEQVAESNQKIEVSEENKVTSKSLDSAELLMSQNQLSKFTNNTFSKASDAQRSSRLKTYQPYRQNRLFENQGSADYLPQVQEGQITLLNAKADQYAVFVRRVALQVFSQLRAKNWTQLGFSQARLTKKFVTVEAKMDMQGKLVSFKLNETSGSSGFDLVLQNSVKDGLWDQNPPSNAALDDGNIHFIFKARTWAEIVGDPGRERRWLLLATGLK